MSKGFQTYVVKAGDSLSLIAQQVLGDANRWNEIWEANKETVSDPNVISPGQELRIPIESTAMSGLEGQDERRVGGLRA